MPAPFVLRRLVPAVGGELMVFDVALIQVDGPADGLHLANQLLVPERIDATFVNTSEHAAPAGASSTSRRSTDAIFLSSSLSMTPPSSTVRNARGAGDLARTFKETVWNRLELFSLSPRAVPLLSRWPVRSQAMHES
jgi:hypothetical protein